jgi:hypothetical protein
LLERRWISVREDHVRLSNGHEIEEFHVISAPSWAGVLAITERDEVVLVRHIGMESPARAWSFPQG